MQTSTNFNSGLRSSGLQGFLFDGATGQSLSLREETRPYGHPRRVALADEYSGDSTPDFFFRDTSAVWIVGGDRIQPQPQRQDDGPAPVERYPVEQDGTWGYINAEGDVVIEPQFEVAILRTTSVWGTLGPFRSAPTGR